MRRPVSLREEGVVDPFLRDLVRRMNFLLAHASGSEEVRRFLSDLERALGEARIDRTGVPGP